MQLRFTFASFTIVLLLVSIFMIAGVYASLIFGVNIALQNSEIQHNNITKVVAGVLHAQGNISDKQRQVLIADLLKLPQEITANSKNRLLLVQMNETLNKLENQSQTK